MSDFRWGKGAAGAVRAGWGPRGRVSAVLNTGGGRIGLLQYPS